MTTINNSNNREVSIIIRDTGLVGVEYVRIYKSLDGYEFDERYEIMSKLDEVLATEDIDTVIEYANDNLYYVEYIQQ